MRLAREGGVDLDGREEDAPRPPWDASGIHGLHRAREWDAVTTVDAPDLPGREARVRGPSRRRAHRRRGRGRPHRARERLSSSSRRTVPRPCAAARPCGRLEPAGSTSSSFPESTATTIELSLHGDERTLRVDGEQVFGSIAPLERTGPRRAGTPDRRGLVGGRDRPALARPAVPRSGRGQPIPCGHGHGHRLREVPALRRGPAHEAAGRAGGVRRHARARVPGALRRRPAREDGRVPAAARERRGPERPALRGVRRRPRGTAPRVRPAHVRRPDDGRDRPARGRRRRDEDRRRQDVRREPRALPERAPDRRDPRRPHPRAGRPPGHRQRLPRPARRRVEQGRLRPPRGHGRLTSRPS